MMNTMNTVCTQHRVVGSAVIEAGTQRATCPGMQLRRSRVVSVASLRMIERKRSSRVASTVDRTMIRGQQIRVFSSQGGEEAVLEVEDGDDRKSAMLLALTACGEGLARAMVLSVATLALVANRVSKRLDEARGDFRWDDGSCDRLHGPRYFLFPKGKRISHERETIASRSKRYHGLLRFHTKMIVVMNKALFVSYMLMPNSTNGFDWSGRPGLGVGHPMHRCLMQCWGGGIAAKPDLHVRLLLLALCSADEGTDGILALDYGYHSRRHSRTYPHTSSQSQPPRGYPRTSRSGPNPLTWPARPHTNLPDCNPNVVHV
eukprot:1187915-Prorocentrum_minimum.AAC.4